MNKSLNKGNIFCDVCPRAKQQKQSFNKNYFLIILEVGR